MRNPPALISFFFARLQIGEKRKTWPLIPKAYFQSIAHQPTLEGAKFDLGYYGWRVVLVGVMAGFGSLFVYTFSVFVKPLAAEFGWSREAISTGFAIAAVTLGSVSPLLGRRIDRFGPRRIILICMTVFACGIASLALLRSGVWQFYLTCFVIGVVGNGALSWLTSAREAIPRGTHRYRSGIL